MASIKNVMIIGAGGRLGPSILAAFDNDPNFTVCILSRNSSTQKFPAHITVHRMSDDYPEAELLKAFKGQDAIVSTIATTSADRQHAAIKAGVKRFVPSEFGSDTRNDKAMAILPQYFRGKADTVEYLKSKEGTGLTWTAFVTGCFFEL
jgi:saccharopine dehydrogenase-like NADP-dependent oxidoreductase